MDTPTRPLQYRPIGNASTATEVAAAVNRLKQDSSDGGSVIIHKDAAFTAAANIVYTLSGFTGNVTLPTDLADGSEGQLIYRDGTGSITVTDATFSEVLSVVGTTLTLRWDKGAWQAMEGRVAKARRVLGNQTFARGRRNQAGEAGPLCPLCPLWQSS